MAFTVSGTVAVRPEKVEASLAASARLTVIDVVILHSYFWTPVCMTDNVRSEGEKRVREGMSQHCVLSLTHLNLSLFILKQRAVARKVNKHAA